MLIGCCVSPSSTQCKLPEGRTLSVLFNNVSQMPRAVPTICVCVCVKSLSRVRLFATPWTVARQAPLSMGFSRQGYWSGLPFPSPGDLPNPGIEPGSPALQEDALLSEPSRKPQVSFKTHSLENFNWSRKDSQQTPALRRQRCYNYLTRSVMIKVLQLPIVSMLQMKRYSLHKEIKI